MIVKRFDEYLINESVSFFDEAWKELIPNNLDVIVGDKKEPIHCSFEKKDTIVYDSMCQIMFYQRVWGQPDFLSFDIYFTREGDDIKSTINISYGDSMIFEFSIKKPSELKIYKYESFHSLSDPDTMFAFDDNSLNQIVGFFNKFNGGCEFNKTHFAFMDKNEDSYFPDNLDQNLGSFNKLT